MVMMEFMLEIVVMMVFKKIRSLIRSQASK